MPTENQVLTDWVNTYTNDLYSWALYKVSSTELAKDLVQDTFLAASEQIVNNGCGALGLRVEQKPELEEKMHKAFEHNGYALLEIMSDVNLI